MVDSQSQLGVLTGDLTPKVVWALVVGSVAVLALLKRLPSVVVSVK